MTNIYAALPKYANLTDPLMTLGCFLIDLIDIYRFLYARQS